nr:MAG TPA: hypothetical protein [Caudoviricetes sp.]
MSPRLAIVCNAPLSVCSRALAALKCFARRQRNYSRIPPFLDRGGGGVELGPIQQYDHFPR